MILSAKLEKKQGLMLRIEKLPLAEEDLIDTWIYGFGMWGTVQADRYIDSIENTLNILTQSPKRHYLRDNFRPPIRICHHISHLIVYTIEENAIIIVRVLHKSMDVKKHL